MAETLKTITEVHRTNLLESKALMIRRQSYTKKIFETFTGRKRLKRHQKVQPLYEIFDIFLRYTVLPDKLDVYPQRKSPSGWLPPGKRVHVQGA